MKSGANTFVFDLPSGALTGSTQSGIFSFANVPVSLNGAPSSADITFFNNELIVHGATAAAVETGLPLYVGSSELPIFVPHDQRYANGDTVDITALPATPTAVSPEPGTFALFGTGLLGACGMLKRRLFA